MSERDLQAELSSAIYGGRYHEVRDLIKENSKSEKPAALFADAPLRATGATSVNENPIAFALSRGCKGIVGEAIDKLEWSYAYDQTGHAFPHHLAAHDKYVDLFRRLVVDKKRTAALEVRTNTPDCLLPIEVALQRKQWLMYEFLFSAMTKEQFSLARQLLCYAITYADDSIALVKRALEAGVVREKCNLISIMEAIAKRYANDAEKRNALFRVFLSADMTLYPCPKSVYHPIMSSTLMGWLIYRGLGDWFRILVKEYGADPQHSSVVVLDTVGHKTSNPHSALFFAVYLGRIDIFAHLVNDLKVPIPTSPTSTYSKDVVTFALVHGNINATRQLIERHGAKRTDAQMKTDFQLCANRGTLSGMEYLWKIMPEPLRTQLHPVHPLKSLRYFLETLKPPPQTPEWYLGCLRGAATKGHADTLSYLLRERGEHYESITSLEGDGDAAFQKVRSDLCGQSAEPSFVCVVCYQHPASSVCYPCRHICLCAECAEQQKACPLLSCRRECSKRRKISFVSE